MQAHQVRARLWKAPQAIFAILEATRLGCRSSCVLKSPQGSPHIHTCRTGCSSAFEARWQLQQSAKRRAAAACVQESAAGADYSVRCMHSRQLGTPRPPW